MSWGSFNILMIKLLLILRTLILTVAVSAALCFNSAFAQRRHKPVVTTHRQQTFTLTNSFNKKKLIKFLNDSFLKESFTFKIPHKSKIDSVKFNFRKSILNIYANDRFGCIAFRDSVISELIDKLHRSLKNNKVSIKLYSLGREVSDLIPNYYRGVSSAVNKNNFYPKNMANRENLISNLSRPYSITSGLRNRNIALNHSHGLFYNYTTGKWEWQRPSLFQTREDLLTFSIVIPFLAPMLENSGANVFLPQERDIQSNEVIVDNDDKPNFSKSTFAVENEIAKSSFDTSKGFSSNWKTINGAANVFETGTSKSILTGIKNKLRVVYTPDIPADGDYAVYISYKASSKNTSHAIYKVLHTGGETSFSVNQKIGGSSWFYLGTFNFKKGISKTAGSVIVLNNPEGASEFLSVDAVRFGGGISVISRNDSLNGFPKFAEGSRYWLQFAGIPDTLVFNLNESNEYKDDYECRAEYANYLMGNQSGPNANRSAGLNIPIDLSLAIHTDAGILGADSTIGTLAIYSKDGFDGSEYFPDLSSRFASRDMADIIQTTLVNDFSKLFSTKWNRRDLLTSNYNETFRPNCPSAIIELFSHQNFNDMLYAQTPSFKFYAARSIYKGILRYLSNTYSQTIVVQPLPPVSFSAVLGEDNSATLTWLPQNDPLEISATPDKYIVYRASDNGGFDNGTISSSPKFVFTNLVQDKIYRFKVSAVNNGGESFPSEELCVGISKENKGNVLIVNGFHRTDSPAWINNDNISGFQNQADEGVAYGKDVSFTGEQYLFSKDSLFVDNDYPGHGASSSNYAAKVIAGNTFNYPYIHGASILASGYSFSSASDEAFAGSVNCGSFKTIDLIYGEEKAENSLIKNISPWKSMGVLPDAVTNKLTTLIAKNISVLISGSYIADSQGENSSQVSAREKFISTRLHFSAGTTSCSGEKFVVAKNGLFGNIVVPIEFNSSFSGNIYKTENPCAIAPLKDASVILEYVNNKIPAAVSFKGKHKVIALGFPFETLLSESVRADMMNSILDFFSTDTGDNHNAK